MRGDILNGVERRRRWSEQDKLSIILEVGRGGATVTQVAQRQEITRQQIYEWRHELRRKGLWHAEGRALFLPLEFFATAGSNCCPGACPCTGACRDYPAGRA